jgi:hypothetical protein
MSQNWITIYRLEEDVEAIRKLQNASLNKPDFGLAITNGLIGSDEWWRQIQSGQLAREVVRAWSAALAEAPRFMSGQRTAWNLCGPE